MTTTVTVTKTKTKTKTKTASAQHLQALARQVAARTKQIAG